MRRTVWSGLGVAYLFAVLFLAVWAVFEMSRVSEDPDRISFGVLLVITLATNRMRFGLPRAEGPVPLSFVFSFLAIIVLPPLAALGIAAAAEADTILARTNRDRSWQALAFPLLSLPLCVYATSFIYQSLLSAGWALLPLTSVVAGLTYFAVASGLSTLRISIETQRRPWQVWNERFFWLSPIYLVAAAGVSIAVPVLHPLGRAESFVVLGFILVGYSCLETYWSRLRQHEEQVQEVADSRQRVLEMLAVAIESKHGGSAGRLRRVRLMAARLAERLGCSDDEIKNLEIAALLHDVGKVGVADYILMKPGRLTKHEFSQVAAHPSVGAEIIESAQFPGSVSEIVRCHHEHWDGTGYPYGLKGDTIPRLARILTVVDCFDALVSDRPYRPALSIEQAIRRMGEQRGKLFDPEILDLFLEDGPGAWSEIDKEHGSELEEGNLGGSEPLPEVEQTWVADSSDNTIALKSQSLQRLTRSPDQLLACYEILDMLGADLHFEKSLNACLRILHRPIPYDKAGIFLLEQGDYILLAAQGLPEHCISRMTLPQHHGVVAEATLARRCVIADAPPSEVPGGGPPHYLEDVKSTIAAPLILDEQVVGMLALCSVKTGAFKEEQARSLNLVTVKLARTLLLSRAVQRISLEAETDPITNLPNARGAFRKLESEVNRAQRTGGTIGVLFMDINGLKPVNDSYGHGAGDELLIETSRRVKRRLRTYDFAARVGGDEFLAILPGVSKEDLASAVESMKEAVSETAVQVADGVSVQVTISIGAALYPDEANDPEGLVHLSDQRMYEEKQHTRHHTRLGELAPLKAPY